MLPPKHCNINLTGPIPRWDEAIPLGNGILGSLFWGPMEHLRISVDIAGLWLRRRPEEKLDKEFTYAKLVELARKGDVAETRRIFDTPYARPTPTKIPAGHLFLDGLPRGSYQASLDLGTAVASFSQKGTTMLRAFLCMGRPVGVLMLPEAYRDAELTVERPSFGNGTQAAEAGNSVSPGSLQQLALPDAIPETEDGMIGFSQKVDDRTAYTLLCKKCGTALYYTAVQAENVEKASRLAKLELCAAEDMGAEKLLQQHKRWWQQYWGKSSLQLPDETLEQLWYRANYFLAAGSEPGNAPMPLQGVWCADDDRLPPWKGDYHNDLNTQFTYCHYLTANHPEQGKVFLDYLWSLRPQAAKFAREFYGTAGECLPSVMDIDGGALGGWPMYSLSPTNQIWLCQMFYEYYRLTGDKEFLRTRVEPYFTATAACLEELLQEGPDGKLVLPVSSSPEIHDDHWIGCEPFMPEFQQSGVDAIVGSVGNGSTLRLISDIPGVKYTEGRFLPYFFPDTFHEGGDPVREAKENWVTARRAILRKPIDRIGYGGYLKLACEFPEFLDYVESVCNEFREAFTPLEKQTLPWGAKLMTMECGMRFLADYLEGDHYFHINYETQNLNRARTQFKLTADMEQNWDAMQKVIEKYC